VRGKWEKRKKEDGKGGKSIHRGESYKQTNIHEQQKTSHFSPGGNIAKFFAVHVDTPLLRGYEAILAYASSTIVPGLAGFTL